MTTIDGRAVRALSLRKRLLFIAVLGRWMRAFVDRCLDRVKFPINRVFNNLRSPLSTSYATDVRNIDAEIAGNSAIEASKK
jgi:hypothetical protein